MAEQAEEAEKSSNQFTKKGWLSESRYGKFSLRAPQRYMVFLNAEFGLLTFKKDVHVKQTLFKRLDSGIAEKDIPLEEIKSIEKFKKHANTLLIQLRYVACSVQSGSVLLLDAENEEERDSWVKEIEKLILTNATGGLNLVREEISESIHKYYDFKLKTSEGVLGSGMTGEVRRIVRKRDKKAFAVKTVNLSGLNYFRLKSLQSEIDILKSLDHPHIVRVYETFVEPKLCCRLVMELCEGGELYDRLSLRDRFDEKTAADIVRQMFKALNYLHENHVVHRDIKLENWLFRHGEDDENNEIVLIDFGLSRRYRSESERMHKKVGTCYYAAPEVIEGDYAGSECDVWSVGVITYMLLSGTAPFDGDDDDEILTRIASHRLPSMTRGVWTKISDEAKDFIRSLLKVDPKVRATAASALSHDWLKVAQTNTTKLTIDDTIFNSLKRYTKYHELKRVAMEFIAYSMNHDDIKRLKDVFEEIDNENNGYITFGELRTALLKHGAVSEEEIQEIFDCLDEDGTKKIRLNEFIAATLQAKYYQDEHLLEEAFASLDASNTGKISVDDLKHVLGRYETDENLEQLMAEVTQGEHKEISYNDFLVFMRSNGEEKTREFRSSFTRLSKKSRPTSRVITALSRSKSKLAKLTQTSVDN